MGFAKYYCGWIYSFICSILLSQSLLAQHPEENEYGSWLLLCGTAKVHEDWSIPAVGIIRHHHMLDRYGFFFFRTGASYQTGQNSELTGGLALLNSSSYSETTTVSNTNQLWLYGEYTLNSKFNDNSFSHRMRFENRRSIGGEPTKVNNRIRYRLQYVRPIRNGFYFKAFDELFLAIDGDTFDQNRVFVGFGRQMSKEIKADIGYFNHKFSDSSDHMLRLSISFSIDLTKKDMALLTD
jgi:hypothetical protein